MKVGTETRVAIVKADNMLEGTPQPGPVARTPSARWAMVSLSLPTLMASLDTGIANAGLPTLAHAFAASFQQVQWIVLAYLLAITTLIVGAGRLGDLIGRRRLLLAGIGAFTAASLLCGVATSLPLLILARAAQGAGAAIMMALSLALVGEIAPRRETGGTMGLLGTVSAIGTALGPSLGGLLISGFGWRSIFLVNLPLGLLTLALVHRHVPADRPRPEAERERFDTLGALLLASGLAAYALAMTVEGPRFGTATASLLAAALLGLGLFSWAQSRAAAPLIPMALLRDPALRTSLLMNLLVSTVLMSTLVVGPFYLALGLGFDAARVGVLLSLGPIVVVLTGIPAGRMADRFGTRPLVDAGLVGIASGSLLLAMLPTALGLLGYVPGIVLITAGYALFQTANSTSVIAGIRSEQRGVLSGLLSLSRNLGLITGASAMGAVFALASGASDVTAAQGESVATGMRATFAVATALTAVALALTTRGRAAAARPPFVRGGAS